MHLIKTNYISIFSSGNGMGYALFSIYLGRYTLERFDFIDNKNGLNFSELLKQIPYTTIKSFVFTVPPVICQVFKIKKPEVRKEELNNTVKWVVQDKLLFNNDNCVIDYFDCEDLAGTQEMFAVAFNKQKLLHYIGEIKKNNNSILAVTVPSLATVGTLNNVNIGEKFVVYIAESYEKDEIFLIKNNALVEKSTSPLDYDTEKLDGKKFSEFINIIQGLLSKYDISDFEIKISPYINISHALSEELKKGFAEKVKVLSPMNFKNKNGIKEQLMAIGGGISYAKQNI